MSTTEQSVAPNLDPTIPAPMTNVAEYGFEGRFEDWADDASYFEYSKAANPIGSGHAPQVPITRFGPEIYLDQPTGVVPLDLSEELGIKTGAATSPALLGQLPAHPRRRADRHQPERHLAAVLRALRAGLRGGQRPAGQVGEGRLFDPARRYPLGVLRRRTETAMYWVHDEPLLRYLGAEATQPRFRATKFRRSDAVAKLEEIASRPGANDKSRVSVLLANANQEQTLTITHVLWAMFGVLPPNQEQRPHRHQSVALDLILDAPPSGCYTLLGTRLDERGDIVDPIRVDWQAGGAFTTPPGMWHAHYNETDEPAHLIPIQDAGLQTHLRSLDIKFTQRRDLVAG